MPQAKNLQAFEDTRELLQQALENPKGIEVDCPDARSAWRLRMRLYATRRREQEANRKRYPIDHPLHGRSHFDAITVQLRGSNVVQILNTPSVEFSIRPL